MNRHESRSFHVECEVANLRNRNRSLAVPGMLVAPEVALTWVPEPILRELGISPVKEEALETGGRKLMRSIGFAFLRTAGFETVDEVVFAQPGDPILLGARTLSGFGARIDPRVGRLVPSGPRPVALAFAGG